ncbi:MAG: CBS domain-containing protein [Anaerolineae bacterium]
MKIITSHERTDMDGLAGMYAAWLLYPDHVPVLPRKMNRNLRDLISVFGEELPFVAQEDLPRERITDVVLVDAQTMATLRGVARDAHLHIIDHHAPAEDLPPEYEVELAKTGAVTSILMEKLDEAGIRPSRIGASLMLLGIYEDTGSLTYATTTARDAHAVARLLELGADLALVADFAKQPLTDAQRQVLGHLLEAAQMHTINGRDICIAAVKLDEYVDELSALIHQVGDVYEPDACLMLTEFEDSVQVIARSNTDAIDVGALARDLGGGGHSKASAALLHNTSLDEVARSILEKLEHQVLPPTQVREIMSTNVHTLGLQMSVRDAAALMRRYGHEGFPVVEDDHLLGVLTRRDVDRALHHELDDLPVSNILHTGPVFVEPDSPVDDVQEIMIQHNLGQVPVVEDGRFVGIVTRTDIIKHYGPTRRNGRAQNTHHLLETSLPRPLHALLMKARDAANDLGYSLYIVGGFVRDLLLGAPNLDLDMVVEGDAIHLARVLAPQLKAHVRSHARFGTAKVILNGERDAMVPPSLDFVTARTEFYERPTELPQVERSSIKQDLYRRDFTINTMAICLDRDRYGELLDFYGGKRDLEQGTIRVLHNLSFVEDPTRILRAVRFEQRLDFEIEPRTAELMTDALDLIDRVTGDRLRHELYLLLAEEEPERGLERLHQIGVLQQIHPALRTTRHTAQLFERMRARHDAIEETKDVSPPAYGSDEPTPPSLGLCYLALLTSQMNATELAELVQRLLIPDRDAKLLHEVMALRESLDQLNSDAMLPSAIRRLLGPYSREARVVLSVLSQEPRVIRRLRMYDEEIAHVSPSVDGHYLRELGLPPGPVYAEILAHVRDALLDGRIETLKEEQALARRLADAARTT